MIVTLHPWQDYDWPRYWSWIQPFWDLVSDDFYPRDLDGFIARKLEETRHNTGNFALDSVVNLGVYADDELVGLISSTRISPVTCQGHISLKPSAWRQEIGRQALEQVKEIAWEAGYKKIWLLAYADNGAIIALIEAVGGIFEGVLLKHTQRNGELVDMVSYAILSPEA